MKQIKIRKSKSSTKKARVKKNKTRRVLGGMNMGGNNHTEEEYDYAKDFVLGANEVCFPESKTYTKGDLVKFLDCSLQVNFDVEKCRYLWKTCSELPTTTGKDTDDFLLEKFAMIANSVGNVNFTINRSRLTPIEYVLHYGKRDYYYATGLIQILLGHGAVITNKHLLDKENRNMLGIPENLDVGFWLPYLNNDFMLLWNYKKQVNEWMKDKSTCNIVKSIFPAYSTSITDVEIANLLCICFLILGMISQLLKNDYTLLFKGGKAIQITSISPNVLYESDDIDLSIMVNNDGQQVQQVQRAKKVAEEISKLIVWMTNKQYTNNPNLSMLEKVINDVVIIKLSYILPRGFLAIADLNYSKTPKDVIKMYTSKPYTRVSKTLDDVKYLFTAPNNETLIMERIYYFDKYASNKDMRKNHRSFFDKIYKSLNYLVVNHPVYIMKNIPNMGGIDNMMRYIGRNFEILNIKIDTNADYRKLKEHIVNVPPKNVETTYYPSQI